MAWSLLPLFASPALRLTLERIAMLNLMENLFLIFLIQYGPQSWLSYLITLVFFLASAFWQTQMEYFNWDQKAKGQCTRAIQMGCIANGEGSFCPAGAAPSKSQDVQSIVPKDKSQSKQFAPSSETPAIYGKVTLYPCVLRHIRLSGGFKDDFAHTYLYIGVPLGIRECYPPLLSVDSPPESRPWYRKAFFSMRPQDQFLRGGAGLSITQKLHEFLILEVRISVQSV